MGPILAFDTSAAHCAAAIYWQAGPPPISVCEDMAKGQAERLLPMIEEIMAKAGLGWPDFSAVGVGIGPGNFTGIRISVALARGLALGLNIPAIGVTGFDVRSYDVQPDDYYTSIPAPRGQVYVQRRDQAAQLLDAAPTDAPVFSLTDLSGAQQAVIIAQIASQRLGGDTPRPAPFYLRPADAAPPSDPPPVILP